MCIRDRTKIAWNSDKRLKVGLKKDCELDFVAMLIINRNKQRWRWFDNKVCHQNLWLSVTNIHQQTDVTYIRYIVLFNILHSLWWRPYSYLNFSWNAVISRATARWRGRLCTVDHVSLPRVYDIKKIPGDGTRTHSQHILKWILTKKNFSKIIPINERD